MNEQGPGDKMTKSNFEAANECEVPDTKEVEQLQKAIHKALNAYADFLDRHSVIYDPTKTATVIGTRSRSWSPRSTSDPPINRSVRPLTSYSSGVQAADARF